MVTAPPDEQFLDSPVPLAERRPGQSAKEMAAELRSASPWKSRFATLLSVHTDERAWRVGAQGEELVAAQLAKLDRTRWSVLHDIPIGQRHANVDHLVFGPGGVFSLNTKK